MAMDGRTLAGQHEPTPSAVLGRLLSERIRSEADRLKADFNRAAPDRIRWCMLDDLLPESVMMAAFSKMPALADMVRVKSPMERKFVCANLQKLSSTLVDIVMAFTDTDVVESIGDIVGAPRLEADLNLYNGGITVMLPGDFMCPHLDNSHDRARRRRREIVLLYYITPCWLPDYEGNLELWDLTRKERQTVVQFCSNRLVLLETTNASWHAIPPIAGPLPRLSVTSYLYAPETEVSPVRLTRFASWPGQPFQNLLFNTQFYLRTAASRVIGRSVGNRHVYDPDGGTATPADPHRSS